MSVLQKNLKLVIKGGAAKKPKASKKSQKPKRGAIVGKTVRKVGDKKNRVVRTTSTGARYVLRRSKKTNKMRKEYLKKKERTKKPNGKKSSKK